MLWFLQAFPTRAAYHQSVSCSVQQLIVVGRLALQRTLLRQDKYFLLPTPLKVELASRFRSDREAYSQAKAPFIQAVLASRSALERG